MGKRFERCFIKDETHVANKHVRRCSWKVPLVSREMKVNTVRSHYTPVVKAQVTPRTVTANGWVPGPLVVHWWERQGVQPFREFESFLQAPTETYV